MHISGKIFMAIGIAICLIGGIMMAVGGSNIDDSGEWDVVEKSEWNGQNGIFEFEDDGDYLVMVRDTVSCDSFSLTITNTSSGAQESYEPEECTEDGSKPKGYKDDPAGWYDMGSTFWVSNGAHEINASHEIYLVPLWEVVGEEIGEAVEGFFQGVAGFGIICCGGIFTIFGLILGLLVNNDQQTVIVQNGAMPGMTQYTNQTMMTQPTKAYADVPVQPQTTTMQQPQGEAFWDQEQPKNPF
tara:strand:- start:1728 stop:2453 length:726 start_codon:yes stop_codon:yes gene_type:complete